MTVAGSNRVESSCINFAGASADVASSPKVIAHISDLHFGRVNWAIVPELLAELETLKPYLIIISGDMVQRPSHRQFREARAFLEALVSPYLVVPGNHDIPVYNLVKRFARPFHRYQHYICQQLDPHYIDDSLVIVGINTARALNLNFAHGRVSYQQLRQMVALLDSLPDHLFRIAVTHHPLLSPSSAPWIHTLGRARQAASALAASRVELVLSGHCHRVHTGDLSQRFPGLGRQILVNQAGTATSTRLRREPNSYSVITITSEVIRFETRWWQGGTFKPGEPVSYQRC